MSLVKRKPTSNGVKYKAILDVEAGMQKSLVAEKYSIPRNTLSTWLASKDKIKKAYDDGQINSKRSRIQTARFKEVDEALYDWFRSVRRDNIPLSGTLIMEKAKEYAERLGIQNFAASKGWFDRWKMRHNISLKAISGEETSCTEEMTAPWRECVLPTLLSRYPLENIFNADEFGLFYEMLPSKTMELKTEKCTG